MSNLQISEARCEFLPRAPHKRADRLADRFYKCDGKQPACSQCILRRIPCSGYRQEFVFVSQASFEIENQAEMKDESKGITGSQKKALVKSNDDHSRMDTQLETRCYELEDDIQIIVQHYAPTNSNVPAESNPLHNQICGAWVEVLPFLSVGIREKQFLLSAIKTLATALRHHKLGNELCQPQILKMYCDSLGLMGKVLKEARGVFHIEHGAAIMCLAVTDVSAKLGKSYCLLKTEKYTLRL